MKHIVTIDDDMFIRDLVGTKLSESYSVASAATATEGMELIHKNATDLIILDLELPDKHGFEVLKELKNDPSTKRIPVIIFSNNDASEWRGKVTATGACDFFVKVNIEMNELKEHVDELLKE